MSPDHTPDEQLKRCSKCGEVKPLSAFSKCSAAKDGLQRKCRSCAAIYFAEYTERNAESLKDKWAQYRADHREQLRQTAREYRERDPEKIKEIKRRSYVKHAMKNREYSRLYRESHVEKVRAYMYVYNRMYREKHPDLAKRQYEATKNTGRERYNARRARILGGGGVYTKNDLEAVRTAQTDKQGRLICWACGAPIIGNQPPPHIPESPHMPPHLDHWIPLKANGENRAGNLHYMHGACNLRKGSKHPFETGRLL